MREGTFDGNCLLTCNWHNWKFDLRLNSDMASPMWGIFV